MANYKKESKILLFWFYEDGEFIGWLLLFRIFYPNFAIKFSYSSLLIFKSNSFSSIISFLWSPKRSCCDATANNIISPPICQANCRNSDCQFSAICLKNSLQKALSQTFVHAISVRIQTDCICHYPMHKPRYGKEHDGDIQIAPLSEFSHMDRSMVCKNTVLKYYIASIQ
jgi:hypothetical protein